MRGPDERRAEAAETRKTARLYKMSKRRRMRFCSGSTQLHRPFFESRKSQDVSFGRSDGDLATNRSSDVVIGSRLWRRQWFPGCVSPQMRFGFRADTLVRVFSRFSILAHNLMHTAYYGTGVQGNGCYRRAFCCAWTNIWMANASVVSMERFDFADPSHVSFSDRSSAPVLPPPPPPSPLISLVACVFVKVPC